MKGSASLAILLVGSGVLVAAAVTATRAARAPGLDLRTLAGGPFEASGAAPAPDGAGILFVDDSRPDAVFRMRLTADGSASGPPEEVVLGVSVLDPEGITTDGTHVYVVGSQSRGKRRDGPGLVRFRLDGSRPAGRPETVDDLGGILCREVEALRAAKGRKEAGLNIEGLAWDAGGRRLLLGLRAPLQNGRALVVPVSLREPEGPFASSNLQVGTPLGIDLGGSGIRGLEADRDRGFYWVIAGGVETAGTSRIVQWDGKSHAVARERPFPAQLKPEGVAPTNVGGKRMTLVLCDTSRYVLLRN
jgi:hypothetical protein